MMGILKLLMSFTFLCVAIETRGDFSIDDVTALVDEKFVHQIGNEDFVATYKIYRIVQRGQKKLPDWLTFDTNSSILIGSPKTKDVGIYTIRLRAQCIDTVKLSCQDKISRTFQVYVSEPLKSAESRGRHKLSKHDRKGKWRNTNTNNGNQRLYVEYDITRHGTVLDDLSGMLVSTSLHALHSNVIYSTLQYSNIDSSFHGNKLHELLSTNLFSMQSNFHTNYFPDKSLLESTSSIGSNSGNMLLSYNLFTSSDNGFINNQVQPWATDAISGYIEVADGDFYTKYTRTPGDSHSREKRELGNEDITLDSKFISRLHIDNKGYSVKNNCQRDVIVFSASLILYSTRSLSDVEEVTLINKWSSFTNKDRGMITVSISPSDVASFQTDGKYILTAGPGNVIESLRESIELSWHLACGLFEKVQDFSRVLQHNIDVGRVTDELGLDVIAWYIYTDRPLPARVKRQAHRAKRQTSTPTYSPVVPTTLSEMLTSVSKISVPFSSISMSLALSTTSLTGAPSFMSQTLFSDMSSFTSEITVSSSKAAIDTIGPATPAFTFDTSFTLVKPTLTSTVLKSLSDSGTSISSAFSSSSSFTYSSPSFTGFSSEFSVSKLYSFDRSTTFQSTDTAILSLQIIRTTMQRLTTSLLTDVLSIKSTTSSMSSNPIFTSKSSTLKSADTKSSEFTPSSPSIFTSFPLSFSISTTPIFITDMSTMHSPVLPVSSSSPKEGIITSFSSLTSSSLLSTTLTLENTPVLLSSSLLSVASSYSTFPVSSFSTLSASRITSRPLSSVLLYSMSMDLSTPNVEISVTSSSFPSSSLFQTSTDVTISKTFHTTQISLVSDLTSLISDLTPVIYSSSFESSLSIPKESYSPFSSASLLSQLDKSPSYESFMSTHDSIFSTQNFVLTHSSFLSTLGSVFFSHDSILSTFDSFLSTVPVITTSPDIPMFDSNTIPSSVLTTSSYLELTISSYLELTTSSYLELTTSSYLDYYLTSSPSTLFTVSISSSLSSSNPSSLLIEPTRSFDESSILLSSSSLFSYSSFEISPTFSTASTITVSDFLTSLDSSLSFYSESVLSFSIPSLISIKSSMISSPSRFSRFISTETGFESSTLPSSLPSLFTSESLSASLSKISGSEFTILPSGVSTVSVFRSESPVESTAVLTTAAPDNSPSLTKSIDHLEIRVGRYYEFQIPENTFVDKEDGNTRNLSLRISLTYNKPIPEDAWLMFNETSQTLYGIPLRSDTKRDNSITEFTLVAKDTQGQVAKDAITLTYIADTMVNHKISVKYNGSYDKFMSVQSNLLHLAKEMADFYGDKSLDYISFCQVEKGSVIIVWSNNSLFGSTCPKSEIEDVYQRISDENGTVSDQFVALFPDFPPVSTTLEYSGVCLIPVTSLAPPTKSPVNETDNKMWIEIVLPALIAILVIVIIALLCLICCRHRRPRKDVKDKDKPAFLEDRRPIIFPEELEMVDPSLKPKTPLVLPSDYLTETLPALPPQGRPVPPYHASMLEDDTFPGEEAPMPPQHRGHLSTPPPGQMQQSEPPPYRLPPPYYNPHRIT